MNAQGETDMRDYSETVKNFSAADLESRTLRALVEGGAQAQ